MTSVPFNKLSCMGAATSAAPLALEFQHLIRGIPRNATGAELVGFMRNALALSKRQAAIAKGMLRYGSREADQARSALATAIDHPERIGIESDKTYGPGTPPRSAAIKLATVAVAAASQDIGRGGVKAEALKTFAKDIVPTPRDIINPLMVALGLGGAYFVARTLTR